jgi:hypothetical protein
MKRKTSELLGAQLDWAVAAADNLLPKHISFDTNLTHPLVLDGIQSYGPSFVWSQGGPIIEREGISIYPDESGDMPEVKWSADSPDALRWGGPTPLIAAMRCFVASKLGDEIEIPQPLE